MAAVIHLRRISVAVQVVLVIIAYCSVSIFLVFGNKYLVGSRDSVKNVSLFVAWIQCVLCVIISSVLVLAKGLLTRDFSLLKFEGDVLLCRPVLRMTCTFVSMLAFNNLCLRYVDVSFYQVAKSLTIIFVVVFSVTILRRRVSLKVCGCCFFVAFGFFLGIDQEKLLGSLSLVGITFGVLSSFFVALNGIFMKQALDAVEGNSFKLTFYSNTAASVAFIPVLMVTGQFSETWYASVDWSGAFWLFLLVTGIFCFLIAWIGGMQMNLTSPLTHTIIANFKAILQTVLAVVYYNEHKTVLWWASNFLVVGGALAYAVFKIKEEEAAKSKSQSKSITVIAKEKSARVANGHASILRDDNGNDQKLVNIV